MELATVLQENLSLKGKQADETSRPEENHEDFEIPDYISNAIRWVCK